MTKTRERLWTSVGLAVALHAVAFVLLQLFLVLRSETLPVYSGPLFIQLEVQPVIQQSRQPAPSASEFRPAATRETGEPAAAVSAVRAAPAGQPLRPAEQVPPKPSGSPFRMEGAAAQEAQPTQGPLRPAGEGVQSVSEEPTLPAAGVKSQGAPLRAEAPVEEAGPALPLVPVDRALAGGGAAAPGTKSAAAAGPSGSPAAGRPGGTGTVSREGVSILWEDPAAGREPTFMPKPAIPDWVRRAGLTLSVEVDFVLTPQGVMQSVRTGKSSGYTDVDTAVLEALRRWKFKPVSGRTNISGRVGYLILPY
jgi:TonB family protein